MTVRLSSPDAQVDIPDRVDRLLGKTRLDGDALDVLTAIRDELTAMRVLLAEALLVDVTPEDVQ